MKSIKCDLGCVIGVFWFFPPLLLSAPTFISFFLSFLGSVLMTYLP